MFTPIICDSFNEFKDQAGDEAARTVLTRIRKAVWDPELTPGVDVIFTKWFGPADFHTEGLVEHADQWFAFTLREGRLPGTEVLEFESELRPGDSLQLAPGARDAQQLATVLDHWQGEVPALRQAADASWSALVSILGEQGMALRASRMQTSQHAVLLGLMADVALASECYGEDGAQFALSRLVRYDGVAAVWNELSAQLQERMTRLWPTHLRARLAGVLSHVRLEPFIGVAAR